MKGIVTVMLIVKLVLPVEQIIVLLGVTSLPKLIVAIKYQVLKVHILTYFCLISGFTTRSSVLIFSKKIIGLFYS